MGLIQVVVAGLLASAGLTLARQEAEHNWESRKTHGTHEFEAQDIPLLKKKHVSYDFAYSVRDDDTGAAYSHTEQRAGNRTHGEYRVSLPDGRVQVVSYVADEHGYRAKVSYEPASPPPEVYTALKYAPGAGKHRQFAPRRYGGRQRRPRIYKRPRTRPADIHRDPHYSYPPEPSLHIPGREDESYLSEPPPSYLPLSNKEDDLSYIPVSEKDDFYLPEPPSSYLPTPKEENFYLPEPPSSYFPKEKDLDNRESSPSYLPQPTKRPDLHKYTPSSTSKSESAYIPESTTLSQYLSPKKSSYYGPYAADSPTFPGPPVVVRRLNKVLGTVQHPHDSSPYQNNSLEVTTYRPKHRRPDTFASNSTPDSKNISSPVFTTITPTTNRPLKLPEVTSYKPSRPSVPPVFSLTPKPVEEEDQDITIKPLTTVSSNTPSTTRSPTPNPLPSSYPLSPEASKSYSRHPPTAPSYSVSIPVAYTPAPSYSESSPLPYSPPQPPYFGPRYGPHFPGPTYPPRITGLPSRLSTVRKPPSTSTPSSS